ncbi:winged helix-turn-helix domain-containing protein [Streptomyces albus subsp. chlorinus]|uniref:helix-turn-helix domain-containing protein n=1 Tax=Streptomyces albus TaxID=1888 RepID=UPI0015709615|nr:helix-turn-helix domain-containing protein [Streptomyces albus]NSC25745.1 winged helix-turn-helix domain-containing protein [Streptomyces albus subsp. chlorinus]
MSATYVPGPPCDEPVVLSRDALRMLALVDVSLTARRVLDVLLALQDPVTGAVDISQAEMAAELGAGKPAVNRGFKELRAAGLAWLLRRGCYQLHPVLTGGRIAGAAQAVPEINATPAADFSEQRRTRFAAQVANLAQSA